MESADVTAVPYQAPKLAKTNGIELCYDIFGDANAEPLVLIMGLGAQMIFWEDEFCQDLATRGFRVIRFDNRDIGLSTKMSGGKPIKPMDMIKLRLFKIPPESSYKLWDMANDVVGLLDVLGIRKAHIVGLSMGGAIAQEITMHHPDRVLSLTSIMATSGNPRLPNPTKEAMAMLLAPAPKTKDEYVQRFASNWKILRVGSFPEEEAKDGERAEKTFARGLSPAGVGRQLRAILASGDRTSRLRGVKARTLVIHGTVDPLVRVEHGKQVAATIPGAKLLLVENMGHALPKKFWPAVIGGVADHAHGATKH
ncbi:MAG: alpha/beta fold hydrolase [Afipia sp.]|nr:alpha/beta fold hydrolase [Afipia sp.]